MSPMTNNIPQMPGVPSTPDQWIPGMGIAPTSSWKMESNWKFAGTKEDLEEKDEEFHWKLHEEPKKMNEIVEEGEPNSIYASVSNYGEMIKEAAVLISALVPDPANPAADPTVTADPTVENNTVEETTNPGGFMNTLKTIPQTVQKGVNAVKADPTVRAIGEGYVAGQNFMEKLAPKIDKGMSFMNQITSVPGAGTLPNFPSGKGQHAYQYMYNNIRRTMEDYVADPNGPKAAMLKEILLKDGFSEAKIQEFVRDAEAERAAQASGLPVVSSVQPSDYGKIIEALQMITQEDRAIRAKKYEFYKIEEEKEGPKKEKPKSIHHELKKKGGEETTPEKKSLVLLKEEYFDLMNEQRFDEASTLIQQVEDPKAARAIAEEFYSAIIDRSRDT